ncbi:MAG: DUF167 domain-containing protein [Candidatus Cloacimonetes bacterium]|nr:DUF167 domain-containing protein [Candidatus Cloacimonadota bacterium]
MNKLKFQQIDGGVVFTAKVVPGSSKTAIAGVLDGMVKIKVAAPPEKGKANAAIIDLLAKRLGLKKNAISIVSGKTSPIKQVRVEGVLAENIIGLLKLTNRSV